MAINVSSTTQWAAKIVVVGLAVVFAETGKLTPEIAAVLSSALISLGVTNGATMIAKGAAVFANTMATIPPPPYTSPGALPDKEKTL